MAQLSDLNGRPCGRHPGATIIVGKSGNTALCKGGSYETVPKCDVKTLREYAVSLNGHIEKPPPPPLPALRQQPADEWMKKVPPNSEEAEMAVLGSILLVPETLDEAQRIIKPDSFYREWHREIYKAMLQVRQKSAEIDIVTLTEALGGKKNLERVGGASHLAEIVAFVPSAAHMAHYAGIVRDLAIKREVIAKASNLVSLAYDGVSVDGLLGEMERTLKVDSGSIGLPSLITNKIEIISGLDFYKRQLAASPRRWVVDNFLARKEISLWSGKVEAGKTTAMRTLVMSVMRGDFFLERGTYPTKVLYVMLDADGVDVTFEEFTRLGWNPAEDQIDFLIDPVMSIRPNSFEQFHQELLERRPGLVVIDPLGRFQKIDDITDYGTTYAMAQFSELAKQTDCHIALLHHIPRGRNDADDPATAGFGSIAIAGGCNARFVFVHKAGDIYTVQSSKGKGGGFKPFDGEQTLVKDGDTGRVTLSGPYSFKDQARGIKDKVLQVVKASDRDMTSDAIARELHVQRSSAGLAGKMLADEGLIGFRKEGQRYVFFNFEKADSDNLD